MIASIKEIVPGMQDATGRPDPALKVAALYTALALGFGVAFWLTVDLSRRGILPFSMQHEGFTRASIPGTILWAVLSGFGPAIAGCIALAAFQGSGAVANLGRRLLRWRIPGRLWGLAWFAILPNLAAVIAGYASHPRQRFDPSAFAPVKSLALFFVMAALDGPLGEEIGWRGVLLPALLRRMSALPAAAIVGVIWYAWHVPIYLSEGRLGDGVEQAFFLYTCVALSLIFTWFFLRSQGSTLLMVYLHDATNYSTFVRHQVFPRVGAPVAPIVAYGAVLLLLAALAAFALRRGGDRRAGRRDDQRASAGGQPLSGTRGAARAGRP